MGILCAGCRKHANQNAKENTDAKPDANVRGIGKGNTDAKPNAVSITVDQSTGKNSCMVPAKDLDITWGDDTRYWSWVPMDDSKFQQVAEVHGVWWFDVSKRFDCTVLSPNTEYTVSFLLKVDKNRLLSNPPFKFKLKTVGGTVIESARFLDDIDRQVENHGPWKLTPLKNTENEWMEFVAGKFFLKENSGSGGMAKKEIEFSMYNTDSVVNPHDGIFIDGVNIQPKK